MASSNQRGKTRKNGPMQGDFGGQSVVGNQATILPPPMAHIIANGSARQQSAPLGYPADNGHMVAQPYNQPRLNNPVMQYAAGEVQIETPSQGNPQLTTIHHRFTQQNQNFHTSSTQVNNYASATPIAYHQSHIYGSNLFSVPYMQAYPTPYFTQIMQNQYNPNFMSSQQADFLTQRYTQQQVHMVNPAPATTAHIQKEKKILRIIDPETKVVTNEKEITASKSAQSTNEQLRKSDSDNRDSKPGITPLPAKEIGSQQSSNVSQQFSLKVAQSILGESAAPSSLSASVPPPSVSEQTVLAIPRPSVSAPPVNSLSTVSQKKVSQSSSAGQLEKIKQNKGVSTSTKDDVIPGKDAIINKLADSFAEMAFDENPNKEELEKDSELIEPPSAAGRAVEIVLEETEKEEEENEKKASTKVQNELLQKITEVRESDISIQKKIYGRYFLLLIRDLFKIAKHDHSPISKTELEALGIDIGSAPAIPSERQRRYDGSSAMATRGFIPGWAADKNSNKAKPYYGRLSDRTHAGQKKRSGPVSRPSIDRTREPVELHKAENAWKRGVDAGNPLQKKLKVIRELLNKITPSTFNILSQEFLSHRVTDDSDFMDGVIGIIFEKAVEEPKFCPLYSDLCKIQVSEEAKDRFDENGEIIKGSAGFRSGILSRCQSTFESKRENEVATRKIAIEEEPDEVKRKELMLEFLENEAKERRRMFGNITFMGQLFRHDLIVPRILNWCIIHLLKNHTESENGDEESVECAIRMIETVGPKADRLLAEKRLAEALNSSTSGETQKNDENLFDSSLYIDFLCNQQNQFSNRLRFLTMNLIETRKNKWTPRRTAEGPKTIEEVHDDARREELLNKYQREQYEKKRYDGRSSSDKRNQIQKPMIISRQSQDGRYINKGSDSSRDQKARAAGAANLVTSTISRKNQSLNSVDQPQSFCARRPHFSCGSGGGGQQADRTNVQARGLAGGLRGAGRGVIPTRENSRPRSRESSETRKSSRNDERISVFPIAQNKDSQRFGGYANSVAGGSAEEERQTCGNTNENNEANEKRGFQVLHADLLECFKNILSIEEAFNSVNDACTSYSPRKAFKWIMQIAVEKISGVGHQRRTGQVICRSLQKSDIKKDALLGIADFCKYAVDNELWYECGKLWEMVAEIICWSIMCDIEQFGGARASLRDFELAFKNANRDSRVPDALLISVLKRLAEIEYEKDKQVCSLGMAFEEIKELHSESLIEALKSCKLSFGGKNLFELLN